MVIHVAHFAFDILKPPLIYQNPYQDSCVDNELMEKLTITNILVWWLSHNFHGLLSHIKFKNTKFPYNLRFMQNLLFR